MIRQPTDRRLRRGSFLLAIIGVLTCVILLTIGYLRHAAMQARLSHRQGSQRVMASVAQGLATLAIHKLQYGPMYGAAAPVPDPSLPLGALYQALSAPLEAMPAEVGDELDLHDPSSFDLTRLTTPLTSLGCYFRHQVFWRIRRDDFAAAGLHPGGFRREKRGWVRLKVVTSFGKEPDGSDALTEEFHFGCRVKVIAAMAPVLSKFTLYVEDATRGLPAAPEGAYDYSFNTVRNSRLGEVNPTSTAWPLVLRNDGQDPPVIQRTLRDFVCAPRGLVYLGGTGRQLVLNLARGLDLKVGPASGRVGESFQLYMDAEGNGFIAEKPDTPPYRWDPGGTGLFVAYMEQGCADDPHPNSASWYAPISRMPWVNVTRVSSIFRLYGSDRQPSPTVVFGNVLAGSVKIRMYMSHESAPAPVSGKRVLQWEVPLAWGPICLDPERLKPLVRVVPELDGPGGYPVYCRSYASTSGVRFYNRGLGYVLNQREPDANVHFPPGDPLVALTRWQPPPSRELLHGIPEPYRGVTPAAASLESMAPFLAAIDAPGPDGDPGRAVWEIPAEETDLWQALRRRGLMQGDHLALNGWVRVKGERSLVIARPLTYLTNGGLLFERANLTIRSSILPYNLPARAPCLLQLVTLDGDITVDLPADTDRVMAGLIARGRILLNPTAPRGRPGPNLSGNLAMGRLIGSVADIVNFKGGSLAYHPPLGAAPGDVAPDAPEAKLLSFAFESEPLVLP